MMQALSPFESRDGTWAVDEHRRFTRVNVDIPVKLFSEGGTMHRGSIRDISIGGMCICIPGTSQIPVGKGVAVSFKLAGGLLNEYGKVVWASDFNGAQQFHGVEFQGVSDECKEQILNRVERVAHSHNEKFIVEAEDDQRLTITINGFLGRDESEALKEEIEYKLSTLRGRHAFVYIDLMNYAACNEECLEHFRSWMKTLGRRHSLMGIICGGSTVGVLQFNRITREAGVADAFMKVDSVLEARQFYDSLGSMAC